MEPSTAMESTAWAEEPRRLAALQRTGWAELPRHCADDVVQLAASMAQTCAAAAVIVDGERQLAIAAVGAVPRTLVRADSPALPLLGGPAAADVVVAEDASHSAIWQDSPLLGAAGPFRSCLAVPWRLPQGWVAGALMVLDDRARPYSLQQREHLARLSALLSSAMEAQRLERLIDRLQLEPVIGEAPGALPNEALLLHRLQQEWQRHARKAESIGLICLTPTTDANGWLLTEAVAAALRNSDYLAALDDGTLVALLPVSGADATRHVAQRIRQSISKKSALTDWTKVRIGVAAMIPNRRGEPLQLLERARHALGRAAQGGPGRIEVFSTW